MGSGFQVEDEFLEDDWDFDDEDSEIDGDCNESQPCRGDEPWLDQDLLALKGEWQQYLSPGGRALHFVGGCHTSRMRSSSALCWLLDMLVILTLVRGQCFSTDLFSVGRLPCHDPQHIC